MPTYILKYSNFNFSQKQKNLIAKDITKIHSKFTGANNFFAQVIFEKNDKGSHYIGGKLVKNKEVFLNGQIRAGRTNLIKKKLILGLKKILIKNTKLKAGFVWVYLEDLAPQQMVEFGKILPQSGKEKVWIKNLPNDLKKRLFKLDKRN